MIFQKLKLKPPPPPIPSAQAGAERATRLVVERVEQMTVVGWAAANGRGAEVELLLHGSVVPAHVERGPRHDVAAALGLPAEEAYGFRVELPPGSWSNADATPAAFQVRCGNELSPVPLEHSFGALLQEWALHLQAMPAGGERERQLYALMAQVAHNGGMGQLANDQQAWLRAQARERQAEAALSDVSWTPPAARQLHGAIERFDGLTLQGWAMGSENAHEQLQLLCNGQTVPCSVVRLERRDVQQALETTRLQLGFEIELPSAIWALADSSGACVLQVQADFLPLSDPLRVERGSLPAALLEARRQEDLVNADETAQGRAERQYRLLLLLEHVAAAGIVPTLADTDAQFVSAQAERFGLQSLLAQAPPAGTGLAPAHDYTTLMVWRLLREFNAALADDGHNAEAVLVRMLGESGVQGEARHRWLLALLPYFCGVGRYAQLRPWLDLPRLRRLADGKYAAELSMLLPELVSNGDLDTAATVMERLGKNAPGWLNTECVGEALRLLAEQWDGDPSDKPGAVKLVRGFLGLLWDGARSYWSRLHDRHLVRGAAALVTIQDSLPDDLAHDLTWAVLNAYALVPAFWIELDTARPLRSQWRPELQDTARLFEHLQHRLAQPALIQAADVLQLAPLLGRLRALSDADAALVARELVQAALPRLGDGDQAAALAAFCQLDSIHMTEPLRLAAHPLARPALLQQAPQLADRIRAVSGVPHHPKHRLVTEVLAQLDQLAAAAAADDGAAVARLMAAMQNALVLLAGEACGYLGVRFAALRWVVARRQLSTASGQAWLAGLRDLWIAAFDQSSSSSQPPAAVLGCWTILEEAQRQAADPVLPLLTSEMQRLLVGRYGPAVLGALPSRETPLALQSASPLSSLLVMVYSCRRNLDTRVQQIRETWARDLAARQIPFLVMVGDGDGRIEGDVLALPVSDAYEDLPKKTLALVEWVYAHTDFEYLLKIDDDCHLAVDAFIARSVHAAHHYLGRKLYRAVGNTDRLWHRDRSASALGAQAVDKSPEPSLYADGGAGYCVSRWAMHRVLGALQTSAGARLTRSAYMEDKLLGDLMALCGIPLSNQGHETLLRRRFGAGAQPVNTWQNIFYPGPYSPTLISHLDDANALPAVQAGLDQPRLTPGRLWPSYKTPVLGGVEDGNQLELLSPVERVQALADASLLVVAVARNERVLMPHFLDHYRRLGARHFVLVDNLSDDGTREYLLQQPDVVLYSADTEYRHSHYGVAWQQAVLAAHALGRWVVLADIDEFLVYRDCETVPIADWVRQQGSAGDSAVLTLMVDMYPVGDLAAADLSGSRSPFEMAPHFDLQPLIRWRLGSGCYSNSPTYVSALRHRLIPDSAPNIYTSQKLAVLRYQPWVRLSEGLHYASNLKVAAQPAYFAHFKYHAGFKKKVQQEVARKQHFNGAEEYRKYMNLFAESDQVMNSPTHSATYRDSGSFTDGLARG